MTENKPQEEIDKITAEEILVTRGLATRDTGPIVHTDAGLAEGAENMTHRQIIDRYSARDHLHPGQFTE